MSSSTASKEAVLRCYAKLYILPRISATRSELLNNELRKTADAKCPELMGLVALLEKSQPEKKITYNALCCQAGKLLVTCTCKFGKFWIGRQPKLWLLIRSSMTALVYPDEIDPLQTEED